MKPQTDKKEPVKILHLEDDARDAELIQALLEDSGLAFEMTRIDSREDFEREIQKGAYNLILSDFSLPSFDGELALQFARTERPEVPFIYVSGTIGEENAVQALLSGATDYLLKTNLSRLGPAVHRALREAEQEKQEKRLLTALRQSEAKYRQIVDTTEDGIWTIGSDGRTVFVNPKMARMLGRSPSEVYGREPLEFVVEADRETAERSLALHFQGQRQLFEMRFVHSEGAEIWATVSTTPMMEKSRYVGGLMMVTDVTEKKKLEFQFLQAQKMEAVGRLAGGVAHDFNNLLTAILAHCDFALFEIGEDHPSQRNILEIQESALRAAGLTRQLLAFSRKQVFQLRVLDPNMVIKNMESLLRRLIGEDLELNIRLEKEVGNIKADAGQLEQVLMNLAVNARDAMPDGGTLSITSTRVRVEPSKVGVHPDGKTGNFVVLTVSDTGCGMDPETATHVFEPFYTTKELGKGTGLGLSTVYEIMEQISGSIGLDTEVGRGTLFRLWFPKVESDEEGLEKEKVFTGPIRGEETILVVEDERSLQNIFSRALIQFGYTPIVAVDSEEALQISRELDRPVDLVVTDVVMPGMSGVELARELGVRWPDTPILYISGYTESVISEKGILKEGVQLLNKPFTPEELVRKIRQVLDRGTKSH